MSNLPRDHWTGSVAAAALQVRPVLFVCPGDPWLFRPGGPCPHAADMAVRLALRGWPVTILAQRTPGSAFTEVVGEVVTVRRGRRTFRLLAALHLLRNRRRYGAVVDFRTNLPTVTPHLLPSTTAFACFLTPRSGRAGPWGALRGMLAARLYGRRPVIVTSADQRPAALSIVGRDHPVHVIPAAGPAATTLAGNGRSAELLAAILLDEGSMRARGRRSGNLRRLTDKATVVVVREVAFGRIVLHLRHADLWTIRGDQLTILLQGVDVDGARAAMRRLGVEENSTFRSATEHDFTRATQVA